ncbi:MAG: zinc-ribbon domain-containing protein [Pseudomonadota bacterium]
MIVTCEECGTRFNLDGSLLKGKGSKVRCSACRHVFTAYPQPVDQDQSTSFDGIPLPNDQHFVFKDQKTAGSLPGKKPEPATRDSLPQDDDPLNEDDFDLDQDLFLEDDFKPDQDLNSKDDLSLDQDLSLEDDLSLDPGLSLEDDLSLDPGLSLEDDLSLGQDLSLEDDLSLADGLQIDDELSLEQDLKLEDGFESPGAPGQESREETDNPPLGISFDDETLDFSETDMDFDQETPPGEHDHDPEDKFDIELDLAMESDSITLTEQEQEGPDSQTEDDAKSDDELEEEIDLSVFDEFLKLEDSLPEADVSGPEPSRGTQPREDVDMDRAPEDAATHTPEPDRSAQDDTNLGKITLLDRINTDAPSMTGLGLSSAFDDDFDNRKTVGPGRIVLLVLFIAILLLAGYSICIMKGIEIPYVSSLNIPYLSDYLKGQTPGPAPITITPDKKSVNGRFVTSSTAGTLFVITGKVTNHSKAVVSHIRVQGTLITKDKVKTQTKTAFCGNVIPEETLKTIEISAIYDILSGENGQDQINQNVGENQSVPFMLVFADLPDNLQNFTVIVEGYDKNP